MFEGCTAVATAKFKDFKIQANVVVKNGTDDRPILAW
jgi:hypothetical protein